MSRLAVVATKILADRKKIFFEESENNDACWCCAIEWASDGAFLPGRNYIAVIGNNTSYFSAVSLKFKCDEEVKFKLSTSQLLQDECGIAVLSFANDDRLASYVTGKDVCELSIVDAASAAEVGKIIPLYRLRRTTNVKWQHIDTTRQIRSAQKAQMPLTIWFTGLSGSGKSTLANALEKRLHAMGKHTMLLDGDNVRLGLNRDLGFNEVDRIENVRRVAEVANLMNDAGLIVLASFISPYEKDRELVRTIIGEGYIEVHVSTPLEVCEQRDVKGLYAKARAGEIPNFTGVTSQYEEPVAPDVVLDTSEMSIQEAIDHLLTLVTRLGGAKIAV